MDGSIRYGSVMAMCGVLLVGCGGGGSNDASTTEGSREAGPTATLPSTDLASDLDPSTIDEASDRLSDAVDAAADEANEAVAEVSERVKELIADYETRIGIFKEAFAEYKPKIDHSTNEDAKNMIQRAEDTMADIEQRVNDLATVSEVEAMARKLGIDQLVTDVDAMIKDCLRMLQSPSIGG